ncbi:lipoprotein [Streptomyces sp. NRRL B-3229]|uniref:lipoprotein n=1 Tax=Streptomyces sp. NRRL B-3229 TaxID=1463836 RepID=UPI0004BF24AF|nr:lipoprotein [Streptomyces sp. NRRL B-3229]
MTRRVLTVTAAGAALVVSSLLGPGAATAAAAAADDPSARDLVDQAKKNLLDAESVRLRLTDHSTDTRTGRTQPVSMDLALDQDGNCAGTLRMGAGGGSVEIVKRGAEVWMKPDTAFWKAQVPGGQGDAVAELLKDRYLHGSTHDAMLRGMAETCDLTSFQKEITADSSDARRLTKGAPTKVDGTEVIPLKGTSDGKRVALYVTSDTPHRLVRATQKGGGTDLALSFSDYGRPVPSKTPSAGESVDVNKLQDELRNA